MDDQPAVFTLPPATQQRLAQRESVMLQAQALFAAEAEAVRTMLGIPSEEQWVYDSTAGTMSRLIAPAPTVEE